MYTAATEEERRGRAEWGDACSTDENGTACLAVMLGELWFCLARWHLMNLSSDKRDGGVLRSRQTLFKFQDECLDGEECSSRQEVLNTTDKVQVCVCVCNKPVWPRRAVGVLC